MKHSLNMVLLLIYGAITTGATIYHGVQINSHKLTTDYLLLPFISCTVLTIFMLNENLSASKLPVQQVATCL